MSDEREGPDDYWPLRDQISRQAARIAALEAANGDLVQALRAAAETAGVAALRIDSLLKHTLAAEAKEDK